LKLPFWIRKGSRAALEGAVREQGGALEGAGGAQREHKGGARGSTMGQCRGAADGSLKWVPWLSA